MASVSHPNSRKRGAPSLPVGTGNDRKRAKVQDARTIAIQSSDPEIKSGQMDVASFTHAREFEIKALETAMGNSKRANNKRAFQTVPRAMRRRTASHNVKRVPKRLRRRAAHEMKEDNTPTVTARRRKPTGHMRMRMETAKKLKDMAKKKEITAELLTTTPMQRATENELRKPPRPANKFRKRQREKTWLPSHIWHAKRAKMITRWRFSVAETPTEKSYRPTHRASQMRGAVAWDESYFSTIHLKGHENNVKDVLKAICGKNTTALTKLVVAGKRSCETWLYKPNSYPTLPIAPATLIWCASTADLSAPRQLFIRIHPSAFLELWTDLLPIAKANRVTLEDLRFEIGSIEITGPSATDTLLAVLRTVSSPSGSPSPDSLTDLWPKLRTLTNPSALPPGALLALNITDPRLHFPPRLPDDTRTPEQVSADIFTLSSTWPADRTNPPSPLFFRDSRTAAVKSQSSQKKINRRKGDAPPGAYPPPLPSDKNIPILIFASRRATPVKGVSGAIGSWTIMLPWKWVLPVWYGIMHVGPSVRFGGLDELRQVAFENAIGYFPDDFPGTEAGRKEEERKGKERREFWEKRPKGKKVEWERLRLGEKKGELGDGFVCDWDWLVGAKEAVDAVDAVEIEKNTADDSKLDATTEVEASFEADTMDIDPPLPVTIESKEDLSTPNAILPPPLPETTLSSPIWNIPTALISVILASPKPSLPPTLSALPRSTLSRGIFTIKLTLIHRGTAADRARIYRLPTNNLELKAKWQKLLPTTKKLDRVGGKQQQQPKAGSKEYPAVPGEEDCIGFVTTGNFNLKDGMAVGLGALSFGKVFGDGEGERKWGRGVGKVVVVRDVGQELGRLARWEIV